MLRAIKADLAKMTELYNIEKERADKMTQYASGLEGEIINLKSGIKSKLKEYIFNQSDHVKIAEMSSRIKENNDKLLQTGETLQKLLDLVAAGIIHSHSAAHNDINGAHATHNPSEGENSPKNKRY